MEIVKYVLYQVVFEIASYTLPETTIVIHLWEICQVNKSDHLRSKRP